jgi:ComF family protein
VDPLPWLLPDLCLQCNALLAVPRAPALCLRCAGDLAPLPAAARCVGGIEACYPYDGALAAALWRLKFRGRLDLAGPLGAAMCDAEVWSRPWDAIVPVPLHWRRTLTRGYNQALLLARGACRRLDRAPAVRHGWLARRRAGAPARSLPPAARRTSVDGAFVVRRPARVRGRRVLLLDDVATTGATLHACRDALHEAGAAEVGALALMRTLA